MALPAAIPEIGLNPGGPPLIIAGPCVIESEALLDEVAGRLKAETDRLGLPFVFKASFDKANRTSIGSPRGPGSAKGLAMLAQIKHRHGVKIVSDVHQVDQVAPAAEILDVIQIPAFLCRQTDLLLAAGRTGKPINVKKGQFLSPWDVRYLRDKIAEAGNDKVMITERGASFGYNNLVVDMRGLPLMASYGLPVVFDATHSVQLPGGGAGVSGGDRRLVAPLARAAVAAGVDGIFMEVHPRPEEALCDGPNSLPLDQFADLVQTLADIHRRVAPVRRGEVDSFQKA